MSQQQATGLCLLDFSPALTLLTIPFLYIDSNLGLVSLTLSYPGFSLTFRLVPLLLISMASNLLPLNFSTVFLKVLFWLGPLLFILYTTPLSLIISQSFVNHKLYADDTQLFLSFPADTFSENILLLQNTINNISSWMASNVGMPYHTIPSLSFSFFSISLSSLTIFFSIPQATKNLPFSSFLSSLAYLLSTGLTPWNFDLACLSFIIHSISFILDPFICSTR